MSEEIATHAVRSSVDVSVVGVDIGVIIIIPSTTPNGGVLLQGLSGVTGTTTQAILYELMTGPQSTFAITTANNNTANTNPKTTNPPTPQQNNSPNSLQEQKQEQDNEDKQKKKNKGRPKQEQNKNMNMNKNM